MTTMPKWNAPLYHALLNHVRNKPASFHVPGHHNGEALRYALRDADETLKQIVSRYYPLMGLDLTEISSTDDLHHPEGSIREAQQLAAHCYGAEETYFLVGGSTSGNLALMLAVCDPGDLIIVQRNVHKSVLNGLKLAGASAVFISPSLDQATSIAAVPTVEQVRQALVKYPGAKAVFLTNPNYYGMGVKLDSYVDICHERGAPLIVDEAHGAHYGFHPKLPTSAIQAGADGVVQSTHKTLPALTMGAMLHLQGSRINRERLREALAMIQSSSPSFPIMASLDISRAIVDSVGEKLFQPALDAIHSFRQWLREGRLAIKSPEPGEGLGMQLDPFRLILTDMSGRLTGYELQRELEGQGCWAEMSDPKHTVFVIGLHAADGHLSRLKDALIHIDRKYAHQVSEKQSNLASVIDVNAESDYDAGEPVLFTRANEKAVKRSRISLQEAVNQLAGEMVVPYPPGIPIVYPGERLTRRRIQEIERLSMAGAKFQGAEDGTMGTIAIMNPSTE